MSSVTRARALVTSVVLTVALWVLAVAAGAAREPTRTLEVLLPRDRNSVTAAGLWVVVRSSGEMRSRVDVRVNGGAAPGARPVGRERETTYHHRVSLAPGVNRIEISSVAADGSTDRRTVSVLASSPLGAVADNPGEFAPRNFHGSAVETECRTCHERTGKPGQPPVAARGCLGCHTEFSARRRVHGPVSAGACDTCHQAASGFAVPLPTAPLCYRCHEAPASRPVTHGPVATGQCILCHDPHGSQTDHFLRLPTHELCMECHGRANFEQHVMGTFHPTSGRPNPLTPGKPLTCASCHEPHAASNRALLRFWPVDTNFCRRCHFRF